MPFKEGMFFFGRVVWIDKKQTPLQPFLAEGAIAANKIPNNSPLVLNGSADSGEILLTFRMPSATYSFWNLANIHIYTCKDGSPEWISRVAAPVSSPLISKFVVLCFVIVLYVLAGLASRAADRDPVSWYRYLDPVYMTAGSDGKGSLSKLQILFFSLIVAGLSAFVVARTAVLSDISSTLLWLIGIAGVGSTAAKGTDVQLNRLSPDNDAWLTQKHLLPPGGIAATNKASWHDIISSDGEFDVYRYQTCIFSIVVGASLLVRGYNDLSTFTIPEALLGILGFSQVVYVGGKIVSRTALADLNKAVTELRAEEKKYLDAATANPDPTPAAGGGPAEVTKRRAGKQAYNDYTIKAESVRNLFERATGVPVPAAALETPVLS
jgi:hypothetical protein